MSSDQEGHTTRILQLLTLSGVEGWFSRTYGDQKELSNLRAYAIRPYIKLICPTVGAQGLRPNVTPLNIFPHDIGRASFWLALQEATSVSVASIS